MREPTMVLNRQMIRLCKGILKAWEQWVDDVEHERPAQGRTPEISKAKESKDFDHIVNS